MHKKKPKWGKPKLIVLTRGKPEERVLGSCKDGTDYSGPFDEYHAGCWLYGAPTCNECSAQHVT
jgi:hypothetical protein